LGKIVVILTSQLICAEIKNLQLRQFDDFGRNWPYTKSRQNSERKGDEELITMAHKNIEGKSGGRGWSTGKLVQA
jgi:hypothetical protein